jgi:hypothetical protein
LKQGPMVESKKSVIKNQFMQFALKVVVLGSSKSKP